MVFGKSASPTGPVDGWMQSGPSPITLQERFFPHPVRVDRHFATACWDRFLSQPPVRAANLLSLPGDFEAGRSGGAGQEGVDCLRNACRYRLLALRSGGD